MAKRNPLKAKVFMANQRETRNLNRELREDGFVRRTDKDPISCVEQRIKSRERKTWISARQRWQHELFIRAQRGPEWAKQREEFLPIHMYRPGSGSFTGKYQEKE